MARINDRSSRALKPADLALLLVASGFWPLSVLARNIVGIPHPERIVAVILLVWITSTTVCWALVLAGLRREVVVRTTFLAAVLLMSGGRLVRGIGPFLTWLMVLALIGLAGWLLSRLDNEAVVSPLTVGLAVVLGSGVVVALYTSVSGLGTDETHRASPVSLEVVAAEDVFVIVLDGYPGLIALSEVFHEDKGGLVSELSAVGFTTPDSAWTSYWSTSGSLPSLLDMSYPITISGGLATEQGLYDMISGENAVVASLSEAGYRTHMIESGWSGSSCGLEIDVCVSSPFFDEAMYLVVRDSMFSSWFISKHGHPFTLGTENSMSWLLENAQELSENNEPDFVFGHLIAPHDPFFFDASCERVVTETREGAVRRAVGFPGDERTALFLDQVSCVDSFMLRLAHLVEESVVVFIGDHGTATAFQLDRPSEEWTVEDLIERMNVFASLRLPDGCPVPDPILIPNLMRHVLSCLSASSLPEVEHRMFLPSFVEVPSASFLNTVSND